MQRSNDWRVCFDGGFCHPRGRAGTELRLDRQLRWNGQDIFIPAAYLCGRGLVLDLLVRVRAEALRAFCEKWSLSPENDGSGMSEDEFERCSEENPLAQRLSLRLLVNGTPLPDSVFSSIVWNPVFPQENAAMSAAMRHYRLDPACGWCLRRYRFAWVTKRRPTLRTLDVTLRTPMVRISGPTFPLRAGESVSFPHPVTGQTHTLRATSLTEEALDVPYEAALSGALAIPNHCWRLGYTITPELPAHSYSLHDVSLPDAPRLAAEVPQADGSADVPGAACVGIIGGSDGPTVIFLSAKVGPDEHAVFSSPSFDPRPCPTWRMEFSRRPCADMTLRLYGEAGA